MSSFETKLAVSEQPSSVSDSIELVQTSSQWGGEWTLRDTASVRLQLLGRVLCCKSKPRIRWIRSKGAILVFLFNCLTLTYYPTLNMSLALPRVLEWSFVHPDQGIFFILTLIWPLTQMLLFPLAGWIADVYFGRYQVIKASFWLMWAGTVLLGSSLCIKLLLTPSQGKVQEAVLAIFVLIAVLIRWAGIVGFGANVVPFGHDQLSTGSGDQLSGFISWFVFSSCVNYVVLTFPFFCPLVSDSYGVLLHTLLQALLLSVALILHSLFRDLLVLEPHTSNPFKLVCRVLKYAWKNKQPQFRSAFTYQDHTKPSRIEFAKSKFGGPFTTEQVEDVKTFLRILVALVPLGAALVLGTHMAQAAAALFSEYVNSNSISCYGYYTMNSFSAILVVVCAVPLYEFLIHPILHYCIPTILTRFGIGIVLYILSCVALFTIDLAAHETKTDNINYTCIFDKATELNHLQINPLWIMLPKGLVGLGFFLTFTSLWEFVLSQSPFNMKGLLTGAAFATLGAIQCFALALQVPFYLGYLDHLTTYPTCGSVYLLIWLALSIFWFIVYIAFARVYHRRERGETKRQQDYTEEYYSKYL